MATPNLDEPSNISDLVKMESINKANSIGNRGLSYASSYGASGLKAYARAFEPLRADIFFCQYAAELLKTSNPLPILKDAIFHLTEIASFVFREENLEFSVHGSKKKFPLLKLKLELLLNSLKLENSRYSERYPIIQKPKDEFSTPVFYKHFFKTPLTVNNCSETLIIPTNTSTDDYAAL